MFKRTAQEYTDPTLGQLAHRRGAWHGQVQLDAFGSIPLAVPGSRSAPDTEALDLARSAAREFASCRPMIERELADHRLAYEDGVEISDGPFAPCFVAVVVLERRLVLEFGYRVPWDEEHTLGARVLGGELIELNGSVVEP